MENALDNVAEREGSNGSSLTIMVRNRLRDAIFKGEYPAGIQLRQDEIAQRFSVSRIPVREALRQLEVEGLVTYQSNKGAVVATMSATEVDEIFEIRIALECRALRLAIDNMVDSDIETANLFLERYDQAADPARWGETNWEFHSILYIRCNRPKLLNLIQHNYGNVGRFLRVQVSTAAGHARPHAEHHRLVELCAAHKTNEAVQLLEEHITYSQKVIRNHLQHLA